MLFLSFQVFHFGVALSLCTTLVKNRHTIQRGMCPRSRIADFYSHALLLTHCSVGFIAWEIPAHMILQRVNIARYASVSLKRSRTFRFAGPAAHPFFLVHATRSPSFFGVLPYAATLPSAASVDSLLGEPSDNYLVGNFRTEPTLTSDSLTCSRFILGMMECGVTPAFVLVSSCPLNELVSLLERR